MRANILQKIRQFFAERAALEVETPLLCHAVGTDPNLDFFTTTLNGPSQPTLYLQTSPEFAMKRLLAAGSGSIFQICKAFRKGESGRFHNPEFTMLEWYRVGFDLPKLMDEVAELITLLFSGKSALQATERLSYQAIFLKHTGLDPLVFSFEAYADYVQRNGLAEAVALCGQDHPLWLDFIFSHKIQPHLGQNALCMVYGYPAVLSSLARTNAHDNRVTERVELFIDGVELGNGYHELADRQEQEGRFDREIGIRRAGQRPEAIKDQRLLAALEYGLPDCSGIAIGLDRLLMLLTKSQSIDYVLAFSLSKA